MYILFNAMVTEFHYENPDKSLSIALNPTQVSNKQV